MASLLLRRIYAAQEFTLSRRRGKQLLHMCQALYVVDKGHLAKLRKRTGFSISNCKKALEMHSNDLEKAEVWLKAEAQAQGWAKATKLSGRSTTQGLIGIHIEGNTGAMVEVKCETDFVTRNENFKTLVAQLARECMKSATLSPHQSITKAALSEEQLIQLETSEGKTLGDHLALAIGSIGENMSLARAVQVRGGPGVHLLSYSHPSTPDENLVTGKFGVILALKTRGVLSEVSRQLCVHVIGKNLCKYAVRFDS
ncbi:Elongation factor Ts-like [Homarus americanus]|uniref:Elongation factor Ts, mitochondrial n=1 Tax=Homarus americanus TaxID=6706 RepID=A0A8J5KB55_HOMAM|nr:Elongation factor Ts-like [Homarus americanus]